MRARRAAQAACWLLEGCERAAAVRAGGPAAERSVDGVLATLISVSGTIQTYSDTLDAGARRLDPEVEQKLQALLVDRLTPLLLRCLQMWEGGAQRPVSCADALFWPPGGALVGLWCLLSGLGMPWGMPWGKPAAAIELRRLCTPE